MGYKVPKSYSLAELTITTHENKTISLINVIDSISIIEDIFSPFLHGSLSFGDSNDLHQIAPIIGEEIIKMVYRTDDETSPEIIRIFRTYRIESSDDKAKDRLAHTLYFASIEAFDDSNIVISKSFKNKSIKFIISDTFKQLSSDKKFNIGQFSGNYHIISPSWSPLQLINYCTSISIPKNQYGSMVLFYENSDGFNFKNLEDLIIQDIVGEWATDNVKNKSPESGDEINPSNNIIKYRILKNSTDTLKSMGEGLYNNAVVAYDNITKSYKTFGYDYNRDFDKTSHLADFKLNSKNHTYTSNHQRVTYVPTTSFRYDSSYVKSKIGAINLSEKKEQIIPSRTSLLSQISAKQIEIDVAGDNRLVAGCTIKVNIPNVTALDSLKHNSHRYNHKKVLVTSIINTFTQKTHKMTLRVADDSYVEDLKSLPEFDEVILKNV